MNNPPFEPEAGFAHNKKFNKMDTKKSLTKSAFLSLATFSWLLPRAAFGK
jgi:hypothetical protein